MNVDSRYRELLEYLVEPQGNDHLGGKTVCYLTFDVKDIQTVKRRLREGWVEVAKNKNLKPEVLSLHEVLKVFFEKDDYRIEAGEEAAEDEYEMEEVYESLGENLRNKEIIENAILAKQEVVKKNPKGILIITDLEAIHPFTRFGPIEQKIYNKLEVPLVVFYPGERNGSALKFLGFYPEDGNYRSKHF